MSRITQTMRDELAAILGVTANNLPPVFLSRVRALKIGIYIDLLARYPDADRAALGDWLGRYTARGDYIRRVAKGMHRHDLDGNHVSVIDRASTQRARECLVARARFREAA